MAGPRPRPPQVLRRRCPFQTRCPRKIGKICEQEAPPIRRSGAGHRIACHIGLKELERMEPVIALADMEAD
jgi:peptide/nickel transport system ATP-binding protein